MRQDRGGVSMGEITYLGGNKIPGDDNVVIGSGNLCRHNNCIVIGHHLSTTRDYQLLIGSIDSTVNKTLTDAEYEDLRNVLGLLVAHC